MAEPDESLSERLIFTDFELLPAARRLLKAGTDQRIGGRAFDLLHLLATSPLQRHHPDAIRDVVWGDRHVNANNLRVQIVALRKLIGPQAISFQAGKGYRFELPVLRGDALPSAREAPRAASPASSCGPLWGRDAMLDALVASVTRLRLITLHGASGAGKTTVALACGQRSGPAFRDGVWVVDLAPLDHADQLPGAVASAMNCMLPGVDALAALGSTLAAQQVLLVLDHCEHLRSAVAQLCEHLLQVAPRAHLLCTSRLPLGAVGEQPWSVQPLDLPAQQAMASGPGHSAAIDLFAAQALAVGHRFQLTPTRLASVETICRRLEGLPLALVLAAASLRASGLHDLNQALDMRLATAEGSLSADEALQRRLQASLDWSHSQLDPIEQLVLQRLGVFAGSFSLDAAIHVASDASLDPAALLTACRRLVDHRLLDRLPPAEGTTDTPPRYVMHAAVQADARRRLEQSGEGPGLRAAHARHYRLAGRRMGLGERPQGPALQPASPADLANLRLALGWCAVHEPLQAMRLCADCCSLWWPWGFHQEARRHIAGLLALPVAAEQAVARADLLLERCRIDFEHEALDAVAADADLALQWLGDHGEPARRARALAWKAAVQAARGDPAEAVSIYRLALAECRRADAAPDERAIEAHLGGALQALGQHEEARQRLQEAASRAQRADDARVSMWAQHYLGQLELDLGRPAEATLFLEAAVHTARQLGQLLPLSRSLTTLGLARLRLGQPQRTLDCVRESLKMSGRHQFRAPQTEACIVLASAMLETGQPDRTLSLTRLVKRRRAEQGLVPPSILCDELTRIEPLAAALWGHRANAYTGLDDDRLQIELVATWAIR